MTTTGSGVCLVRAPLNPFPFPNLRRSRTVFFGMGVLIEVQLTWPKGKASGASVGAYCLI